MKSTGMQVIGFQKSRSNRECHVDIFLKFLQNHVMCSHLIIIFCPLFLVILIFPNFIRYINLLQKMFTKVSVRIYLWMKIFTSDTLMSIIRVCLLIGFCFYRCFIYTFVIWKLWKETQSQISQTESSKFNEWSFLCAFQEIIDKTTSELYILKQLVIWHWRTVRNYFSFVLHVTIDTCQKSAY